MFDWMLWLILLGISLPGIVVAQGGLVKALEPSLENLRKAGQTVPAKPVLKLVLGFQTSVFVAVAAAIGVALAPQVGLGAPFFQGQVAGDWGNAIWGLLKSALPLAFVGSAVLLLVYYLLFRPFVDRFTLERMESLRSSLGLAGRLLYGGAVEEVLVHWGLMTLLAWAFGQWWGAGGSAVWTAMVVSGVLFGLSHLPAYIGAGCKPTALFVGMTLLLNLWVSLVFGTLFWWYGLEAAMLGHGLLHLLWWLIERIVGVTSAPSAGNLSTPRFQEES